MTSNSPAAVVLVGGLMAVCACASDDHDAAQTISTSGVTARIRYHYDALGRLIQAVAPDGAGAHYSYDAVGNITAIRRLATDTLSLIEFNPRTGTTGTVVTLYGSGFDLEAAENAVTFNGTTAAVTAATETTLTVSVPGGATTGRIAVSNANGNATSGTDFVVNGATLGPTITEFTPHVGTLGTVVTVAGTNFRSTADDNNVTMAGRFAVVVKDGTSPTPTQLKVSVPSATASGTIRVVTPLGSAVSTDEFFAVPVTVNPAEVEFTGRLAVNGPTLTVATTVNGKKAALLFDGQAGQI